MPQLDRSVAPVCIAEVGCNHMGNMNTAIKMIKMATQFCGADIIKFQKRTNKDLLTLEERQRPHPNPENSYGATYGEHRENLELGLEQHRDLKQICEEFGSVYSTSVWDVAAAREIISLEPKLLKVPSAINTNKPLLDTLFKEFSGEIHISLGMTTRFEEDSILEQATHTGRAKDLVLYHCISGYPVANEHLYLLELSRLIEHYQNDVKAIGFSGHHVGIAADIAALTLGATNFERHFTLDRTWKGTDHAASLEPDGLRRLNRDLKSVNQALISKPQEIVELEMVQRDKLKKFVALPNT
jgi:sialic acid synthase